MHHEAHQEDLRPVRNGCPVPGPGRSRRSGGLHRPAGRPIVGDRPGTAGRRHPLGASSMLPTGIPSATPADLRRPGAEDPRQRGGDRPVRACGGDHARRGVHDPDGKGAGPHPHLRHRRHRDRRPPCWTRTTSSTTWPTAPGRPPSWVRWSTWPPPRSRPR